MKKLAGVLGVVAALGTLGAVNVNAIADDNPVIVNADSDNGFPQKYPTLNALCNGSEGDKISLGDAVISPQEIFSLQIRCDRSYRTNHVSGIRVVAAHALTEGTSSINEEVTGFARVLQSKVNGKPELDVLFTDGENLKIASRSILRLDARSQPLMKVDHFDGTLDPAEVAGADQASNNVSGIYIDQSALSSAKTCAILASGADDLSACAKSTAERKSGIAVGIQVMSTPALGLGWKSKLMPTNHDLNRIAGRVDFQKAVAELTSALGNDSQSISDDDAQSLLKAAKDALANSGN